MAPIVLAMLLLGIAAKVDARPYNQDNEIGSVDNYFEIDRLAEIFHSLADTCANRAKNSARDVEQLFDVVCLVLNGEGSGEGAMELGSGEGFRELGSGEFPEERQSPRWIYNFDPIIKIVTPDRLFQQTLSMIVEGACQAAEGSGYVASDIESFCRHNRRSTDASVAGNDIGSGDGFSISGDGEDFDNNAVNWLDNDAFFFANLGEY